MSASGHHRRCCGAGCYYLTACGAYDNLATTTNLWFAVGKVVRLADGRCYTVSRTGDCDGAMAVVLAAVMSGCEKCAQTEPDGYMLVPCCELYDVVYASSANVSLADRIGLIVMLEDERCYRVVPYFGTVAPWAAVVVWADFHCEHQCWPCAECCEHIKTKIDGVEGIVHRHQDPDSWTYCYWQAWPSRYLYRRDNLWVFTDQSIGPIGGFWYAEAGECGQCPPQSLAAWTFDSDGWEQQWNDVEMPVPDEPELQLIECTEPPDE